MAIQYMRHVTDKIQYPRHPWQSWRDRYLKQLRTRPPSSFNIPANAPPSPPSDNPPKRKTPPVQASPKREKKSPPKKKPPQVTSKVTGKGRARDARQDTDQEYTVEELETIFSAEDWEELYAFVDIVESVKGEDRYDDAWKNWADSQDKQTAQQWRQYYDKVVRPQWLKDPEWKKDQIREKIEKKHDQTPSPSQSISQDKPIELKDDNVESAPVAPNTTTTKLKRPSEAEDELFEEERYQQMVAARRLHDHDAAAYIFYARDQKWPVWGAQPDLDHGESSRISTIAQS
jgi:hypothetical protein